MGRTWVDFAFQTADFTCIIPPRIRARPCLKSESRGGPMTRLTTFAALLVGITCLVAFTTTTQLVAATNTLIMNGLNNPRGLALGPDGGIYVAEAGVGGAG